MLVPLAVIASLLACPPTTVSKRGDEGGHYLASPYGWLLHDEPAQPASEPPEFPDLPLWDLEATRTQLGEIEDHLWLRWVLDDAASKPMSSQQALVGALASATSSPERMLWWLAHAPANGDARDALIDAYNQTKSARTKLMLAIALALTHREGSCPVEVGPDGACRMPGTSITVEHDILVRRDGIAVERANHWTREALALAKRATIDPSELAMQALLAELELAAAVEDYESVLVARLPEELSFEVEEYLHDSGVPEWERIYEKQVESSADSKKRVGAFQVSQMDCIREQFDGQDPIDQASAHAALLVLLRRAKLMLALAETLGLDARTRREDARKWTEHRERTWYCAIDTNADAIAEQAIQIAQQCVEIGTRIGGSGEILEACFDLLEADDYGDYEPLPELFGEPGATTTMHAAGVIPPQPSAQQRNPVE